MVALVLQDIYGICEGLTKDLKVAIVSIKKKYLKLDDYFSLPWELEEVEKWKED